jgi:N-acetylglutamate synthase-like GNAT family acetyltransferase
VGLTVRRALRADAEAVARIYVDSWSAGFGDLMGNRELDSELTGRWRVALGSPPPHRWWVAERNRAIVGFAGIGPCRDPVDPHLGELDTIAVDPPCWRTGVGATLMSIAIRALSADGYREAILWTVAGYARGAAFYEATGWTPNGARRDNGRQVSYTHPLPAAGRE